MRSLLFGLICSQFACSNPNYTRGWWCIVPKIVSGKSGVSRWEHLVNVSDIMLQQFLGTNLLFVQKSPASALRHLSKKLPVIHSFTFG